MSLYNTVNYLKIG